ncbi:Beta-lactamase [Penicillium desertorum]|uniref:Beta-lactamase n=1 Tax=Penicillium desertorum TaxID=1303715 RepID=A0A9X0BFH4_9EURO|nr:Beta-lactamase [Penicillium desertorum]
MGEVMQQVIDALKSKIDLATAKPNGIPGLACAVVDRNGDLLFEYAAGKRGVGSDVPMTTDTVFWLASCTKMIVSIAALQLAEQGILDLDDAGVVEKLAPELKEVKVLQEDAAGKLTLMEKKQRITMRMLLCHTAGFGYSFSNAKLQKWYGPIGQDELSGHADDALSVPLVNQPGSKWEYGVNIDWAGELIMRASGLSLNDYFHKHIFQPLGIKDISMFPSADMKVRLAYVNQRSPDGKLSLREGGHLFKRALKVESEEDIKATFNSGGAGCFAVPSEYCKILAALLNNGQCPKSGTQILKPQSVRTPELYPQPPEHAQGWSLGGFHHVCGTRTGRSPKTVWWAGLANLYWWVDHEKGLGGLVASQILPFGDAEVIAIRDDIETILYKALAQNISGKNGSFKGIAKGIKIVHKVKIPKLVVENSIAVVDWIGKHVGLRGAEEAVHNGVFVEGLGNNLRATDPQAFGVFVGSRYHDIVLGGGNSFEVGGYYLDSHDRGWAIEGEGKRTED